MNINELMDEWLETYQKGNIKSSTYGRYRDLVELHIKPFLGLENIETVDKKSIINFLKEQKINGNVIRQEELSPSTVNMILSVIKSSFDYACEMDYITVNPCFRVKRLKLEPKQVDAFTLSEQKVLEKAIMNSSDRRLKGILLCLYTGLRIGELLALSWDDVNFKEKVIRINKTIYSEKDPDGKWISSVNSPKSRSSNRIIPLPRHIVDMLREEYKHSKSKWIVENKKGERMSVRSYQYLFEKLTIQIGIRKLNFHALRHTFATRAIECGIDIKTVSDLMGHKNTAITLNRYAHCMLDHKFRMIERLKRVI